MSEWRNGKIGELATGIRGVSYTPEQLKEFKNSDTITLLRSNNIQSGWLQFKNIQIVPKSVVSEAQILRFGDIAICMSNGSKALVGKAGPFVNITNEQFTVGAFCSIFRPASGVDCQFTKYIFQSSAYRAQLDISLAGSAINNLRNSEIELFSIKIPPPEHQKKIAEVLDVVDVTIRQTEAIIEKLKLVKQGLLHDLLTRGIDANGELRPPQSQAPHLYKDSLLGSIPRTWSVERLDGLLSNEQPAMRSGPFGSALLKSEQVESGVPLLGIDNVHTEEFIDKFTRFVSISKFHELSRYAVRPDDLMITIMGTVGRCCLVPSGIRRALSSKHTWTITLDQSKYSPLLAMLQINYSLRILEQLARDEQGGIMSAIRSDTLRSLNFPVPPIKEQIEIAERMQAITSRINTESEVLRKLTCEKLGLMDDLLTGRVRVTPLFETIGV